MQDLAHQLATYASLLFILFLILAAALACFRPHIDPRPVQQERRGSGTQRLVDGDKQALNEAETELIEREARQ